MDSSLLYKDIVKDLIAPIVDLTTIINLSYVCKLYHRILNHRISFYKGNKLLIKIWKKYKMNGFKKSSIIQTNTRNGLIKLYSLDYTEMYAKSF